MQMYFFKMHETRLLAGQHRNPLRILLLVAEICRVDLYPTFGDEQWERGGE